LILNPQTPPGRLLLGGRLMAHELEVDEFFAALPGPLKIVSLADVRCRRGRVPCSKG
jgi:hypothetical protein